MSEETDALNNRIRQLENQVADMQRLVQDTSDLFDIARANGLDKFLTGHGLVEYGGGIMRLDNIGVQIYTADALTHGIYWVDAFSSTPTSHLPRVATEASALNSALYWATSIHNSSDRVNDIAMSLDATSGQTTIQAMSPNGSWTQFRVYASDTEQYCVFLDPLWLATWTSDPATLHDGQIYYRTDTFRPRIHSNGITGNLGVEIQSTSAAAVATNGTITTAGVSVARVAPAGAVTGIILQAGTTGGQTCTVVNESVAASTVTFAASGTSHVSDGTSSVIAGLTARRFVWDSGTSLWYPCK